MVYSELLIINGIVLTREQVKTLLGLDDETFAETDICEEFYDNIIADLKNENPRGDSGLRLFDFPCCSPLREQFYILGYVVHTYYRKYVQCRDCGEHTVCDKCIGETTGGYRNVIEISEKAVKIGNEKICIRCDSDQVGILQIGDKEIRVCGLCNEKQKDVKEIGYERKLKQIIKDLDLDQSIEPGYYYMLNDCLSCT